MFMYPHIYSTVFLKEKNNAILSTPFWSMSLSIDILITLTRTIFPSSGQDLINLGHIHYLKSQTLSWAFFTNLQIDMEKVTQHEQMSKQKTIFSREQGPCLHYSLLGSVRIYRRWQLIFIWTTHQMSHCLMEGKLINKVYGFTTVYGFDWLCL